jgi:hypothetical protein
MERKRLSEESNQEQGALIPKKAKKVFSPHCYVTTTTFFISVSTDV